MLVANSEFSSSILPRSSPLIPNPVETLDKSSSLVSSINGSHAVQSPNQDRDGNNNQVSVPPQNPDGSPSAAPLDETLIVPSPLGLEQGECSDAQVMTKPKNHSKCNNTNLDIRLSGSDTDVDSEENKPLCRRFRRQPPKIVESTCVVCFLNSWFSFSFSFRVLSDYNIRIYIGCWTVEPRQQLFH